MSPTKRTSHDRQLFITNSKFIVQAARVILAAAIVLAIVWPASAVSVTWSGGSGILWSTPANWSGGTPAGNDVLFTSATGASSSSSTPTNEVATSVTVNTLWYGQEPPKYHTTKIDSGVTLKISGSTPPPTWPDANGMAGNYSLLAGNANAGGTNTISQTVINGGGTLDVSSATGGDTGGDIVVRQTAANQGSHTSILDLSGLASFNANINQLLVGYSSGASSGGTNSTQRPAGTLYLAQNNTITLNNTGTNTSTGLVVGHSSGGNSTTTSVLYLGQNNTINVNNVAIGGRKGVGSMLANPAFSGATLTMRGVAGGTNRLAGIYLGDNMVNGTSSTTSVGTMDLTGVTADILATSIILGRTASGAVAGTTTGATGTLTMSAGTIDVTGMTVALQSASSACPAIGTVNVGGGNLIIGASGITLAQFTGGTGSSTGTLNISGGTVTLGANITDGGGNSTIKLTGGTLNMQNNNIGTGGAPIDTFTVSGGNVSNLNNVAVTSLAVAGDFSLSSGILTLGNTGKIDMRDGAAHTLTASNLSLPSSSTLYFELSNNISSGNDLINLSTLNLNSSTTQIAISPLSSSFANGIYPLINYGSKIGAGSFNVNTTTRSTIVLGDTGSQVNATLTFVPARNLTWKTGSGTWDINSSANWKSSAADPDKYFDLDTVTFDDVSGTGGTITLTNSGLYPGAVTVNSALDYTFNAATANDKISGPTGLTKNGTGALTINAANDYLGVTYLNAGKIIAGNAAALGSTAAGTVIANGATLDLNNQQLAGETITVQGSGVGGLGAIVNNKTDADPGATQYDISNIIMTGDTTLGGMNTNPPTNPLPTIALRGRWAVRALSGATASISTGGNAYNLTKTGNNQVMLVGVNVDTALANVNINEGVLALEQTTTLGDPSKTLTVDGGFGGGTGGALLQLRYLSNPLNKKVVLKNGGIIYPALNGTDTDNTISGTVNIENTGGTLNAGGARADGYAANSAAKLTISGVLSGSGSATLTKMGPGTVTLSNTANTFSGTTNLNDGTLIVNGNLPGTVTMGSLGTNTTLAGTGTITANVSDNLSTAIAPGATGVAGSVGTLNFGGNLSLGALGIGQIAMDLSNSTSSGNDLINLTNPSRVLSLNYTTNIKINELNGPGSLAIGTYRVINYAGSLTGSATNLAVTGVTEDSRRTYTPNSSTANQINLAVAGSPLALVWKGDGSINYWDVKNNLNWKYGLTDEKFYNLDSVTFDNTGDATMPIYITGSLTSASVSPASITVNSSQNYTFGGYAKITGATGITKSGTGTLILANAVNDNTGSTTINGGKLQIGDGSTSNIRIGSGQIVNNAALVLNAAASDNYTLANAISGSGALEQKGGNVITLSAPNSYAGLTTITAGAIIAGTGSALGTTDAGTVIANGATLDINNQNLGGEAITAEGQGMDANGDYILDGAITNNNTASSSTPQNALRYVTLTGDTWFGGNNPSGLNNVGRWDIRSPTGGTATLSTGSNAYNITKVGNNQVTLVGVAVDTGLANINVNQGIFAVETTSTLGDPSKTVTVDGSLGTPGTLSSATLQFYNLATPLNKKIVLQNGGSIYARNNNTATDNTVAGAIAIADTGGILNAGGTRTDTTANANTTMTINGVISGSSLATLTKAGPGTIILNAANTFSGTTNLNDGALIVNGTLPTSSLTMSITGTGTTTLGGIGTIGTITSSVSDGSGTVIAPGASAGTLNFGGNLSFNGGGQISMDLSNSSSSGNDLINVTGIVSINGATNVAVNPINGFLQGDTSYPLIQYTGGFGGSTGNLTLTGGGLATDGRQTYGFTTASNKVMLVVTGSGANLTWKGGAGANAWDVKTNTNWTGASDSLFWNGDSVTFDDSSVNNTVNLNTTVNPAMITVNAGKDYTITGTGIIAAGSLTKQGTGTLTLATTNTYSGQTKVENGTLLLNVPISNNSPILVTGGTLKPNVAGALGSGTIGTTINGGTLDVNGLNLQSEPITVSGAGVDGAGAIVNNSNIQQYDALSRVTLAGDTTFGGTKTTTGTYDSRWDIGGTGAYLSTGGNAYNLTKTGNNHISIKSAVDAALANITIDGGILRFEDPATLGDPSKTVTVNSGGDLQVQSLVASVNKKIVLNGGRFSTSGSNLITENLVISAVTVNSMSYLGSGNALGIMTFTSASTISGAGGLTKTGAGTVFIECTPTYDGDTGVNNGLLQLNSGGAVTLNAITSDGLGLGTLGVDNTTSLTADSINVGTLTIGAGSTVTIAAIPGGPLAGLGSLSAVPEPSTWAMLMLAAMGLGIYWRRGR